MDFEKARFNMVEQQIRPWDVLNTQLLDLLFHVKRENFVADNQKAIAFVDTELPLPNGSRMLQPKMEARILQELNIAADEKILEIGTGSGYLTALLASVGKHVYSLDIDANMTALAKANLARAGIQNVTLVTANGVGGLPTNAPFDVIVVGGALPNVPEELTSQLAVGGRMRVWWAIWPRWPPPWSSASKKAPAACAALCCLKPIWTRCKAWASRNALCSDGRRSRNHRPRPGRLAERRQPPGAASVGCARRMGIRPLSPGQ